MPGCATELETTAAAVALAWIVGQPGVSSVILGPRTLDQLHGNLNGIQRDLPDTARARLDDLSAPPNAPVNGIPIAMPA